MSEQPQEFQTPQEPKTDIAQPETLPQPQPQTKKPRRKLLIIAGGAVLVVILAAAAYMAGTLFNKPVNPQGGLSSGPVVSKGGGPVTQKRSIEQSQVTPAPELPTVQADVRGVFLSRSGNTFTIGTGNVGIAIQGSGSGQMNPQVSYDGPTYEVVFTKDTVIYKNTTPFDPSNSGPIQQTVAPGTLDDLNTMSMISVWGKKTGDRYVADIILYTQPQVKLNGGSGGSLK